MRRSFEVVAYFAKVFLSPISIYPLYWKTFVWVEKELSLALFPARSRKRYKYREIRRERGKAKMQGKGVCILFSE